MSTQVSSIAPKTKFSFAWMAVVLVTMVSVGLVGGQCVAYAAKLLEGSHTLTYKDHYFKISFKYPVDNIVTHATVGQEDTLYVGPFKYHDPATQSYYQSNISRGPNNSISMFITRNAHSTYDYALIGFDVLKSSCQAGSRKTFGGSETETTLTAAYSQRRINGNPAAVCITTTRLDYGAAAHKQSDAEYSAKAKIYISSRGSYSLYISARRNPPTATEKQVVQDILESFKPL